MVCGAAMARRGGGGGWGRSGILYGANFDHPYDPPRAMAKLKWPPPSSPPKVNVTFVNLHKL